MPAGKLRPLRHLLAAAAVLALLALSGCAAGHADVRFGDDATSSPFSDWGSGWGGNRDWGGSRG